MVWSLWLKSKPATKRGGKSVGVSEHNNQKQEEFIVVLLQDCEAWMFLCGLPG